MENKFTPEQIQSMCKSYYDFKESDQVNGFLSPITQNKHREFIDLISPMIEHEREIAGDDEYIWGPFDFIRGESMIKTFLFKYKDIYGN